MVSSPYTARCLIALGWTLLVCFALRAALLGRIGADVRAFQAAYVAGFMGYLALVWVVTRCGDRAALGAWRWWLIGCIAVRALLLATTPGDDMHRYVWEGRIQLAGFNPFRHPPNDPQLSRLRDDDWGKINHPDYPAIYGPVAQLQFLAAAALDQSGYVLKSAHLLWDVLIVVVLGASLRRLGRPPHGAVLYALCPLVLTAFGIEGHLDSLMLLFVALAVYAAISRRTNLAAAMVGLAMATKVVAVVLLPWFVLRTRGEDGGMQGRSEPLSNVTPTICSVAIVVTVVALCYAPYLGAGAGMFLSLLRFGTGGEFFSTLGAFGVTSFGNPFARWMVISILAALLIGLAWWARDFPTYGRAAMAALLLLTPVVHYWYLSWVLALLPFGARVRWITAALAMVVYFEAELARQTTGVWSMPPWAPAAVWLAFGAAWVVEVLVARRAPG